jgi:hypothetical protein
MKGSAAVDQALQRLAALPFIQRAALGRALLRVIAANGTMSVREADLLRALCGELGIPLPATSKVPRESEALPSAKLA